MEEDLKQIRKMFPDAPEKFIRAMFHNIYGKKHMWKRLEDLNDDSK
tara:strand:+ start:115 stop:252 length:138 start_codon:yes stop_codon:yes gene_type:complete